jgi:hypothetical protein
MNSRTKGGFIPWDYGDDPPVVVLRAEPMPWTGDLQSFKDAYFERAIWAYERAWHSGYGPALSDAVRLCEEHGRPLPPWLNDALLKDKVRKIGRQASVEGEERDRYVHWRRWDLACAALEVPREYLKEAGFAATPEKGRLHGPPSSSWVRLPKASPTVSGGATIKFAGLSQRAKARNSL